MLRELLADSPLWKLLHLRTAILAQDHTPSWSSWDLMTRDIKLQFPSLQLETSLRNPASFRAAFGIAESLSRSGFSMVSFFDMARSPRSLSSKHTALFPSQCSFRETLLEATVHKRPILSGLCPELRWSHLRKYTWLHIKVNEYSKTLQNKRASSYN